MRWRKRGANSFALLLGGGDARQFHFRALKNEGYAVIHVKDSFKDGHEVTTLRTENDVRRFFAGLSVTPGADRREVIVANMGAIAPSRVGTNRPSNL
jgi:hypothetical protein